MVVAAGQASFKLCGSLEDGKIGMEVRADYGLDWVCDTDSKKK